jgi:hypothetical protein
MCHYSKSPNVHTHFSIWPERECSCVYVALDILTLKFKLDILWNKVYSFFLVEVFGFQIIFSSFNKPHSTILFAFSASQNITFKFQSYSKSYLLCWKPANRFFLLFPGMLQSDWVDRFQMKQSDWIAKLASGTLWLKGIILRIHRVCNALLSCTSNLCIFVENILIICSIYKD